MKMIYYDYNIEVDFQYGNINNIVIENPVVLDQFISNLNNVISKKDDKICILDNFEKQQFVKITDVIFSPIELTYNKKDVQKALLNTILAEIVNLDLSYKFADTCAEFLQNLNEVKMNTEYEIKFDENIETSRILKCFDIHLEEPTGMFIERVIEYISVISKLLGKRIFIFVGCSGYIEESQYEYLEKHVAYENVAVIFVECNQECLKSLQNQYIMDVDLCEI